jgi:hypothetical protein
LLLVLLVAGERRLAEVHLNRLSASPVFENDDLLDGDEIRVRLSAVVPDVQEPDLSGILRVVWRPAPTAAREAVPTPPLRWSSSRSPPPPSV